MKKELCSIDDIAKYLNVSVPFIRKLVRSNSIPCYKLGNRLKFDIKEIDKWLENCKQEDRRKALFY